ncbi:MAG: hypothetical protein OXK77_11430 [Gemmatimonadota bacterium]|nr:hypothetical protein [Gemmatimonadota bacterium]MDE2865852.1 hypothetical protein [Gemmatimonadota bacterium]
MVLATGWRATAAMAQDPRAPEAVGSIPAQTIAGGQSASLDLTAFFADADGDALVYAATVSDIAVATVSVSGAILTIAGVATGTAVVTVFASDPGGLSATQRAQVTVEAPNEAPGLVGTIPGQALAPGQWIAISVSSYFNDPEGDVLVFSATASNEAVASVAVAGDVVTITRVGTGTAIVTAVARDPEGLGVQQSITVGAIADQVAPGPGQPGGDPPRAPQPERPQAGPPMGGGAVVADRGAYAARQPDPFPPRLLAGFVASTGYTLASGRGNASAGYMGASPVAHVGEFGDVVPSVGEVSYGVTDDLTVAAGSGFLYYNVDGGSSDVFPYFAPKFRVWNNAQISVAVGGYAASLIAEETLNYYGASVAGSVQLNGNLTLHASGGMVGISAMVLGETHSDQFGILAAGGDFRVTPRLGLAGEFRRVGMADGTSIVTGALRFFQGTIAGEAGAAYYLVRTNEPRAEVRPVVSVAYRF